MKIVSWNVNGIRACMKKGFCHFFDYMNADLFALQETKMQPGQADLNQAGYYCFMNSADKKGYSGTLIYAKDRPLDVIYGIHDEYNDEGRIITLEYENFYFVNAYVPNSQEFLKRLSYRLTFEEKMRAYLAELDAKKPVIYCGDLNVAHEPIDIKNPESNTHNPGYSVEERNAFTKLLNAGFIDTFRYLYPDKVMYSWWSYRFQARERNAGWRIDYFVVSSRIINQVTDSQIATEVEGSDHAPIILDIEI